MHQSISELAQFYNQNVQLPAEGNGYFCYLYIKQLAQAWIAFAFLVIGAVMLAKASLQFHRARKISVMTKLVKGIYIVIFGWAALFIIKIIFSQILFWMQEYQEDDKSMYYSYSLASKYLFVIDISGVFLVQTALILVPYNWMNKIIQIFQQLSNLQDIDDSQEPEHKNFFKFEMVWVNLLRIYLISRLFFFALIIPFVVIPDPPTQATLVKIMLVLLLVEAGFVLGILIFGLVAVRRNKRLQEIVDQSQIDTMLNQYVILIICATTRLVLDSIFVFLNFQQLDKQDKCYIDIQQLGKTWQALRIVNIIVQGLFTHYLPIYVILRIFKVELNSIDLSESLLAGDTSAQSTVK